MTEHVRIESSNGIYAGAPRRERAHGCDAYGKLADTIESAEFDPSARVILIRGEGDMFTAGNDVGEFAAVAAGKSEGSRNVVRFIQSLEAASGTSARLTKGVDNCALSASTTRSQCSSIVVPTPTARPCTAATSGRVQRASDWMKRTTLRLPSDLPGCDGREFADIVAGGEHVALAADQDHAGGRIELGGFDGIGELAVHRIRQRVLLVGARQRERENSVVVLDPDVLGHGSLLYSSGSLESSLVELSWKLVLNARQPARDDIDLRAGKSVRQRRVDLRPHRSSPAPALRGPSASARRARRARPRDRPAARPASPQPCDRRGRKCRPAPDRAPRPPRPSDAVLLAEDEQQPRLRRRDLARGCAAIQRCKRRCATLRR